MTIDFVLGQIGKLGGTLRFFPSDPEARIGIAEQFAKMASNEDQLRWLVSRLPELYTDWPGLLECRAVFCTRYKPLDGVEAALGSASPAFGALCPEDEHLKALETVPRSRQLTGEVAPVSADSEMQEIIAHAMERKRARDPLAGVRPATQSEIDRIKEIQEANRRKERACI